MASHYVEERQGSEREREIERVEGGTYNSNDNFRGPGCVCVCVCVCVSRGLMLTSVHGLFVRMRGPGPRACVQGPSQSGVSSNEISAY